MKEKISVVTPSYMRPQEVLGLINNLAKQIYLPFELILVDGNDMGDRETENIVKEQQKGSPFMIKYVRSERGTAIQRNFGIEHAQGNFIAFIDDDVRLDNDFFKRIMSVYVADKNQEIGGLVGYRKNKYFKLEERARWRWYKRLNLLKTYVPGRYDYETGYPINANMQPEFTGIREVDFMTTACAVWRRRVLTDGHRFDPFFVRYGVLEDAHFSLIAKKKGWKLYQCGDARCEEMSASGGREDGLQIGFKSVVNYYYVFIAVSGPLGIRKKIRFWRYQLFEFFRILASGVLNLKKRNFQELTGRLKAFIYIFLKKDINKDINKL